MTKRSDMEGMLQEVVERVAGRHSLPVESISIRFARLGGEWTWTVAAAAEPVRQGKPIALQRPYMSGHGLTMGEAEAGFDESVKSTMEYLEHEKRLAEMRRRARKERK